MIFSRTGSGEPQVTPEEASDAREGGLGGRVERRAARREVDAGELGAAALLELLVELAALGTVDADDLQDVVSRD
jgi:hypothetical protein